MTNRELVVDVLETYGAMTSRQICVQVNNKHGVILTPSQVAGALRPLTAKGYSASSKDERNQNRYWITDEGKRHFAEEARKNG